MEEAHDKAMRILSSPHQDSRPAGTDIDMIVLHAMSLPAGTFDMRYVEQLFMGTLDCDADPSFNVLKELKVSAHFVIDRSGAVTQFVPCMRRAWHAGASSWQGREHCNDYAVGIEMLGDEQHLFTAAQYRESARLCRVLMQRFPAISRERIVGHSDIAPGRKWDPGRQWSWSKFTRSLAHIQRLELNPQ